MLKLSRYLKGYAVLLLVAVVLLFGQAMLDLSLPNMMSQIVNVGIQKSGIADVAPRAVAGQTLDVLLYFMDDADVEAIRAAYTPYDLLSSTEQAEVDKTFPKAGELAAQVLTGDDTAKAAADVAVGHAMGAMQQLAQASGTQVGESSETSASIDLSQLAAVVSSGMVPQQALDDAIAASAGMSATLTDAIAAAMDKAVYRQLGADTDRMQTSYIVRTGGVMVLLSIAMVACAVGAGFCYARIGSGVARDLRRDVFAKVSGFSNAEMDKFSTASLITRTTNDVNQVQMLYTMGMRMLVFAPIMGIGGIIMALRKSPAMSWIIAAGVGVILVIIGILMKTVMPRFKRMQKLLDRLNLVARENLSGIMVVRAFSNQKFQEDRFDKANDDLTKNSLFVGRAMNILMPTMMLVMNGLTLFIIWLGADQISKATMQVGDMMAFMQYAMQVIMSFLFIAMIFVMVPRASVSAERIDEVLRTENSVKDPENPKHLPNGRAKGLIEFNNVSFRYEGAEEDVLHNVSFTAKPGQTTAFIGATGSGKSSLINLIPRFYDATGGSVTLDGIDVRDLPQHELRDNVGYVPQKGLLFSGNINTNLRYGDEEAADQLLRTAAEVAQATEFIDNLDEGFESSISQGGTNVSGGQRQRISIARALVKKAPVYIFDDSFSALDFATDARLRAALGPYTEGATVLIVAQRVSTIMTAQQIVVLDDGAVVGTGTHRELLDTCPTYREIAESQLSAEELA